MKTKTPKSALYNPPVVEVLAVASEGILCESQHEGYQLYEGNDKFGWEE